MEVPISSHQGSAPAPPFQKILAVVDGSDASMRAARVAIQMASVHAQSVIALYVVDDKAVDEVVALSGEATDTVRRQLETKGWQYLEYTARIAKNHGVECDRVLRKGIPHAQIADMARTQNVDLVVIGDARPQSTRRALVGGLVGHVIEFVPCSVLVVKAD